MRRPLLAPLVPLYVAGAALRARRVETRRLAWPVVSIGNLSTGGAGKTPLTIALARLLTARGVHVDVLSRGYGRTSRDAARVRPEGTAAEFGDEPLLIARAAQVPVYVASQRYEAGLLAEADAEAAGQQESGVDNTTRAHILDDGFQHRQLDRTVDILLMNREDWQDSLLPAGNLRESLRAARRASVIAIPSDDAALADELRAWGWQGPVWRLKRTMDVPRIDGPVLAFCGIARPEQFFAGLESAGVQLTTRKAFSDHYEYTESVVEWLAEQACRDGAVALVTTEKDAVRMGGLAKQLTAALPLHSVALSTAIEDENSAMEWLLARLNAAHSV